MFSQSEKGRYYSIFRSQVLRCFSEKEKYKTGILAKFVLLLHQTRSSWSINKKGVAEQSSVFASEIFITIYTIPEVNSQKNEIHEMPIRIGYIGLNPTFLSKDKITKKNNLEVFKQALYKFCVL